jgi:hypothetical protein
MTSRDGSQVASRLSCGWAMEDQLQARAPLTEVAIDMHNTLHIGCHHIRMQQHQHPRPRVIRSRGIISRMIGGEDRQVLGHTQHERPQSRHNLAFVQHRLCDFSFASSSERNIVAWHALRIGLRIIRLFDVFAHVKVFCNLPWTCCMLHVAVLLSGHVTCCLKPVITILRTHPYMTLRCEPVLWGGWTSTVGR